MNRSISIVLLASFMTFMVAACSQSVEDNSRRDTVEPRPNQPESRVSIMSPEGQAGVLILTNRPNSGLPSHCAEFVVWDDAAVAYYRDLGKPDCVIEVGKKGIPSYEKARRDRGLPPGTYRVVDEAISRLKRDLERQLEEQEVLQEQQKNAERRVRTNIALDRELGISACCSNLANGSGYTDEPVRWFATGCSIAESHARSGKPLVVTERTSECLIECASKYEITGIRSTFCSDGCETFTRNFQSGVLQSRVAGCAGD